jgi:hypothetical protein
MRVIYKQPIIERIRGAVLDANRAGRKIDHVELTVEEGFELAEFVDRVLYRYDDRPSPGTELRRWLASREIGRPAEAQPIMKVFGISIRIY